MKFNKTLIILLTVLLTSLLISGLTLTGCSKPRVTKDGYIEVVSLKGDSSTESREFTISKEDNRLKIKTTDNNKDGLTGQIIRENGSVASTFSVGDKPNDETWPFNLKPGKYRIKVNSTGTKFEIIMEEKQQ